MFLKNTLIIFIIGIAILIGAIILNLFAGFIGLNTWYDLLIGLNKEGLSWFSKIGFISFFYLFFIYPFLLGLIAYFFYNLFIK